MTEPTAILQRLSVSASSRLFAFLAYLLGPIGWLLGFLFKRHDPFVRLHIRQSIGLWAGLIIGAVAWLLIGGVAAMVPYFGPLFAFASFALVMALTAACLVLWVVGMLNALRGRARVLALFGDRAERLLGSERIKPKGLTESYQAAAYANLAENSRK